MHTSYLKVLFMLSAHCLFIIVHGGEKKNSDFNWIGKMARDLRVQELIVSGIVR